jgi:hypothetical protein
MRICVSVCVLLLAPTHGTDHRAGVRFDSASCGGSLLLSWFCYGAVMKSGSTQQVWALRTARDACTLFFSLIDGHVTLSDPRTLLFPDSKRQEADR